MSMNSQVVAAIGTPGGDPHIRPTGAGVDRGELPHLSDTFELADVEAIESDQRCRSSRPQAEPERAIMGLADLK